MKKYKISEYRKQELLSKLKNREDIQKEMWQWVKQEYINLQEFRFILENLQIVNEVTTYTRIKNKESEKEC